ncbi:hypothetical protein [Streptomyces sp. NPDC059063]|uniref:hypothetical protein n=1 Tax=unclassified Streptomyces TaxID=2593676 RepID=UPI00368BCEE2
MSSTLEGGRMGWFKRRRSRDSGPILIHATEAAADAAMERAAAAGLEPGDGSLRAGDARCLVLRGSDAEKAKRYLLDEHDVTEGQYRIVVETPRGNWGRDIDGLYLERLLPWQLDTTAAECSGVVVSVMNAAGVIAAARGRGDNFLVTVRCGTCAHEWYDGLRYRSVTAVRCPSCAAVNRVDSHGIIVADL